MEIKKFTKPEMKVVAIILMVLFVVFGININISIRKGRDSTRKDDISAAQKAIGSYLSKYGVYPLSNDQGQIVGCFDDEPIIDKLSNRPVNAIPCHWGESGFESLKTLVRDPRYDDGWSYLYNSDGENYSFYISLEGQDEPEYTIEIVNKGLKCGTKICNYGRGNKF